MRRYLCNFSGKSENILDKLLSSENFESYSLHQHLQRSIPFSICKLLHLCFIVIFMILFLVTYVCVCVHAYVNTWAQHTCSQKRETDPLEFESQTVASCMCTGTELGSSGRAEAFLTAELSLQGYVPLFKWQLYCWKK